MSDDRAPLELYDQPLSGPMIEIYARQRADLDARLQERVDEERADPLDDSSPVAWRTIADGVPLCAEHALGLLQYGRTTNDLRPIWDDNKIGEVARQTGMQVADIQRLHARYYDERCAMCGVSPSANRCLNCAESLHPNWPAVYCTNRCALEDA